MAAPGSFVPLPGPADGTHIARSCRTSSHATGHGPQKPPDVPPGPCPQSIPVTTRTESKPACFPDLFFPAAESHGRLQLRPDDRLSCKAYTFSVTALAPAAETPVNALRAPQLYYSRSHSYNSWGVGMANLAGQARDFCHDSPKLKDSTDSLVRDQNMHVHLLVSWA
ncbi:hypothetical protein llap_156 [Limosa lapponica baueri]|uniref:Uncharacterized protein n=1 Tax=Limosa lapponica baueri TaxID=1758121 RepID=A0A2I0UU76_LIMLA|nr:hypothetical protein llap_156 [Limosa lapponica baueri]